MPNSSRTSRTTITIIVFAGSGIRDPMKPAGQPVIARTSTVRQSKSKRVIEASLGDLSIHYTDDLAHFGDLGGITV